MIEIPAELLGRDFDFGEVAVSTEAIRVYAENVGDAETLAALRSGRGITAPPTFCLTLHRGMRPEIALPPGTFGVYGGHDLEFLRPIRPGETYRIGARLSEVYEKSGRTGVMTIVARQGWIRSRSGETAVRIHERQIVRRKPEGAAPREGAETRPRPPAPSHGDPESTATPPRAAVEIELGAELGPLRRPPTAVEQVGHYVASGEMKEGLFTDEDFARGLGYRGIVVPGPMLTAFLEHFLRRELPGWRLERLGSTFRMPTISGDAITLSGVVSEHHQRPDGEHIVCDLVIEHPSGERAVTASARLRRADES